MYDTWDRWALAALIDAILVTMVTAWQATCLYIVNVKYICKYFSALSFFFPRPNPFTSSVLVEVLQGARSSCTSV